MLAITYIAIAMMLGAASFATGQGTEVSTLELNVGDNM